MLGLAVNAGATVRYERNRRAIEARHHATPSPVFVYVLGIGSVVIAATMALVLARSAD